MNIEELRDFCLSLPHVTEGFPFDDEVLVFKIFNKIFLLTDLEKEFAISIKNTPELIVNQREMYEAVSPGFHLNKKHWNTVKIDGSIDDETLLLWIKQSYNCVVAKLPYKDRKNIPLL